MPASKNTTPPMKWTKEMRTAVAILHTEPEFDDLKGPQHAAVFNHLFIEYLRDTCKLPEGVPLHEYDKVGAAWRGREEYAHLWVGVVGRKDAQQQADYDDMKKRVEDAWDELEAGRRLFDAVDQAGSSSPEGVGGAQTGNTADVDAADQEADGTGEGQDSTSVDDQDKDEA